MNSRGSRRSLGGPEAGAGVQASSNGNLDGEGGVAEKWVRCSVEVY